MESIAPLEHYLAAFISVLKLMLEAIAAICVPIGSSGTMQLAVAPRRWNIPPYLKLQLRFGGWVAIAHLIPNPVMKSYLAGPHHRPSPLPWERGWG
jgi:uncharacterized membrane protein